MRSNLRHLALALAAGLALSASGTLRAEPAFAVRTGYRCSQCHVNRSGGGMRTPFGSLYTQVVLPSRLLSPRGEGVLLPADPRARFGAGANLRALYSTTESEDLEDSSSFESPEANLYLLGRLLPGRLSLYLDETVAPGGASAREAFGLFEFAERRLRGYVKVGKFLPAYGYRLPDDAAFIRQQSGFSYQTPDLGLEVGLEPGRYSIFASATNGAGGSNDDNRSKRFTLQAIRRFPRWRVGVQGSNDIDPDATTTHAGLLAGASFGRLALLGEGDWVESSADDGTEHRLLGFLEADVLIVRGVNLKLAHDWIDPDRDVSTDARVRESVGVEYVPLPFVQLRAFVRWSDGPPQVAGSRDSTLDLELHLFF